MTCSESWSIYSTPATTSTLKEPPSECAAMWSSLHPSYEEFAYRIVFFDMDRITDPLTSD